MFYLKAGNHIYIYIYIYEVEQGQQQQLQQQQQQQLRPSSWSRGGLEKEWFQQSESTRSGAGEKETLNIYVMGKNKNPKQHTNVF